MKAALGSFIVLPLLGIALIVGRFGFRPLYMIVVSVLGEVAGLFLYSAYNHWKVTSVLSGLASGALTYRGTAAPRSIVAGLLMFAALGMAITGCVLILYGIYRLARRSSVISRLIVLLAPLGIVACGPRTHSPATASGGDQPTVADSLSVAHAKLDLSGSWATGSVAEPEARRLKLRLECNYTPPLWILEQAGDTVSAFLNPESRAQGVLSPEPPPRIPAKGRLSGVDLTLEMPGARYVLRYDSTSRHLRGTRNGAPFWAVRQDIVRATGCIPPP